MIPKLIEINRLIYKIRNDLYIKDDELIKNINYITIKFDDKVSNSRNLPFCTIYNQYFNIFKINRKESFIIITSFFNLKFISNCCSHIFIGSTFKFAPKKFYQVINILVLDDADKFIMPIVHVIMTNKSYHSYNKVFIEIKNLLDEYKINYNFENSIINCDF